MGSATAAARHIVARAAMAATPAMQRETVGLAVVAILSIGLLRRLLLLRLSSTSDEGRQAHLALAIPARHAAGLRRTRLLVARGIRLLIAPVMWLLIPLLMMLMMLLAFAGRILIVARRIGWLLLGLAIAVIRFTAAHHGMALILALVIEGFVVRRASAFGPIEGRLLLSLTKLLLRCGDQAEIMLGVLIVILRRYRVARSLRVTRKLDIFFRDVRRRTADLHVRTVRFIHP